MRSIYVTVSLCHVDHDQQICYHHAPTVKPEAATTVVELLMVGAGTSETCWAVNKSQDNKLEKLLHLLVDLFEQKILLIHPTGRFSTGNANSIIYENDQQDSSV